MKTMIWMIACLAGLCMMTSCEKDEDLSNPGGNKEVESTFNTMYAGATWVEWERKGVYWVVDFQKDHKEMEAWFDQAGAWYQTETDILPAELPEAVKTAFAAGEYKNWRIEDVDLFERKDAGTFYVLDVELGEQEYDLHYAPDGTLIKTVAD